MIATATFTDGLTTGLLVAAAGAILALVRWHR